MQFINNKIAILGLGEEGKDLLAFIKKNSRDCSIKVFDKIKTVNLENFDLIFRSPGFHRLSPMLKKAEKVGVKISSATKLFFELCPSKIIGVTGTKGKGTTSALIYEMLKKQGFDTYVGGNIGTPPLTFIEKLTPASWVVLELSSFQLQDLTKSPALPAGRPHIAV